ncbi:MAG: class I SAM-dependent methyltransferase [Candidatus Omnitrophota bacterium]
MDDPNANGERSNRSVNWANIYDFYEVQMRDVYRTIARAQNESHFELLKHYLKKKILNNHHFAEIGFGCGVTLRLASSYFEKVSGLDVSPKNVALTLQELENEGYKNIELFVSDILQKDERFNGKFDVISFIHGLEHFSSLDYKEFFENIRNYLKPGGFFTGALPNNLIFNYRMCPHCRHVFEIDGHLSTFNVETLAAMFKMHNWTIIYLGSFNPNYFFKKNSLFRFLHGYGNFKILKKEAPMQLEFIVKKAGRG